MNVPGAPSVSDLKGQQPAKKAGKTVSSTGVPGKSGEPYPEGFVYDKPKLAWDSGNRTKMVKPLAESAEEKAPVGTVGTVTPTTPWVEGGAWGTNSGASRAGVPTMKAPLTQEFLDEQVTAQGRPPVQVTK